MRAHATLLSLLALLSLVGCGGRAAPAAAPALAPIDSVLLEAPQEDATADIPAEQQARQDQASRNGENSRVGLPLPQRHGLNTAR
ncbi:MAG: hypothetical protein VKS61_15890 [Candidatus Sericytochromatia bacterium]|nr:hypothetical protein [Candidatus Sericytochromatia bacterium]